MSYKVNCYFTLPDGTPTGIEKTEITYRGDTDAYFEGEGFIQYKANENYISFFAYPSEGYVFDKWIYRVGSAENEVNYSSSRFFEYRQGRDIWIRAAGKILKTAPLISKIENEGDRSVRLELTAPIKAYTVKIYARKSGTSILYEKDTVFIDNIQGDKVYVTSGGAEQVHISFDRVISLDDYGDYEFTVSALYETGGDEYDSSYYSHTVPEPQQLPRLARPKITELITGGGKRIKITVETVHSAAGCEVSARKSGENVWYTKFTSSQPDYSAVVTDSFGRETVCDYYERYFNVDEYAEYEVKAAATGDNVYYIDSFDSAVKSVTVKEEFEWENPKTSGGSYNLTASEWNAFTRFINCVRNLKGLSEVTFTRAVKNRPFTADMYKEARNAVQGIGGGAGSLIPDDGYIYCGAEITADMMNILVGEINAVVRNLQRVRKC